jgi:hypothetical protein
VNDIKIDLNGNQLIIEGKASKLSVGDLGGGEQVTVAAGATVTDSTITLSNNFAAGQGDQLIVKGILKNSTVVANANAAKTAIIELAGQLDGVTFSCKISADAGSNGVCIEATAAGAQIINSRVDFDADPGASTRPGATTPRVVDAGNGVTIIGSTLRRIDNFNVKALAVRHGGGALVIQNSTIDLGAIDDGASDAGGGNFDEDSRAVYSDTASGSIILTGNVFRGYNRRNKYVVEIKNVLGAAPQQIANNQFQITEADAIGIRSVGAASELIAQYATGSGNTFGASSRRVVDN